MRLEPLSLDVVQRCLLRSGDSDEAVEHSDAIRRRIGQLRDSPAVLRDIDVSPAGERQVFSHVHLELCGSDLHDDPSLDGHAPYNYYN